MVFCPSSWALSRAIVVDRSHFQSPKLPRAPTAAWASSWKIRLSALNPSRPILGDRAQAGRHHDDGAEPDPG